MTPVVLLGGLNVVRALGLAGIPVIIASSARSTPSMASRYCAGVIELPPIADREGVVDGYGMVFQGPCESDDGQNPTPDKDIWEGSLLVLDPGVGGLAGGPM